MRQSVSLSPLSLNVTVGGAQPLESEVYSAFVLDLVRREMAQEVMVSFWGVISHNDRLTGLSNPSSLPQVCARKKKKKSSLAPFVFKYDGGFAGSPLRRWSHAAGRSCLLAKCLSSPCHTIVHQHARKDPCVGGGGSEAVMKRDRFLSARSCFRAHFLSMGQESRLSATAAYGVHLGDVPVSRTDPRFFSSSPSFFSPTSVYVRGPPCRCVFTGVYLFQSDDGHL